jgi:hypothetical protein
MISGDVVTGDEDDVRTDDPLSKTLERTARELRVISASVDDLEHAVGAALSRSAPSDAAHIRELQTLDVVRQQVAAVADFLEALNETVPEAWRVDAAAAACCVTLADMAARLSGGETDSDRANFAPPEVYELFD